MMMLQENRAIPRKLLLILFGWSSFGWLFLQPVCRQVAMTAGSIVVVSAAVQEVSCPIGWGGQGESKIQVIPAERINDGYCDCPTTGADEPDTEACAGSASWPGARRMGREAAPSDSVSFFVCPQQPNLKLSPSKVRDGLCDCCDGADEATGTCQDICDEVLAEERKQKEQAVQNFAQGSKRRKQAVQYFSDHVKQVREDLTKNKADLFFVEKEMEKTENLIAKAEYKWISTHLNAVESRCFAISSFFATAELFMPQLKGMLHTLEVSELVDWIIHACQIAGEMDYNMKDRRYEKTCVPLRLAGLDASLYWKPKTNELALVQEEDEYQNRLLAQILDHNLRFPREKMWYPSALESEADGGGRKPGGSRRRLSVEDDDEDDFDDYAMHDDGFDYDEYNAHQHHDDYVDPDDEEEEYERERSRRRRKSTTQNSNNDDDDDAKQLADSKRQELLALVKENPFAASRNKFLERSSNLLSTIDELEVEAEEKEAADGDSTEEADSDEKKESEEESGESTTPPASFDPMALPMIKTQLNKRRKAIERGFNYAVSAEVLLESLLATVTDEPILVGALQKMAMMTLFHGQLSALHVWELYQTVLPELKGTATASGDENDTCQAPWAKLCPPKSVERSVLFTGEKKTVSLPPAPFLEVGKAFCDGKRLESDDDPSSLAILCAADNVIPNGSSGDGSGSVPNGYFGYFSVTPRGVDDLVSQMFDGIAGGVDTALDEEDPESMTPERKELLELKKEKERLEQDSKDLNKKQGDLEDSVGGASVLEDGSQPGKFGPDGELHALRDSCFSVEAGKYIYELCPFGRAAQKEDEHQRGTDLGRWSQDESNKVDEESGKRIWKWTQGTKCWNGPQRSATAHVSCGPETKIISADEPDTCRYVFEVESYIACDDAYRIRHGL